MTYHDIFGLEEKKDKAPVELPGESVNDPFGIGTKEPDKKEEE